MEKEGKEGATSVGMLAGEAEVSGLLRRGKSLL